MKKIIQASIISIVFFFSIAGVARADQTFTCYNTCNVGPPGNVVGTFTLDLQCNGTSPAKYTGIMTVNGVSLSYEKTCTTGTWTAPTCPTACGTAASSPSYTCVGGNGLCSGVAPTATCGATSACPVPGACNPAIDGKPFTSKPTANLCSVGSPSVVSGSSTWNWTCLNDGITSSCSATCSVSGAPNCDPSYGLCNGLCNGGAGIKTRGCVDNCGNVSLDSTACTNTNPCASSPMKWTEL